MTMADLTQQMLHSMMDSLIKNGGRLSKSYADTAAVVDAKNATEKADRVLTEKIISTNKTHDQKLNTLNNTLSAANKQTSLLAASLRLADSSLDELVSSSNTTAEYLSKEFPDKVAAGLNAFTSKTGAVIKDFKDVLQLQELGAATKNMADTLAQGTRGQSANVLAYLKDIQKSGSSFAKMAGMSDAAAAKLDALQKVVDSDTATTRQKHELSKLVAASMPGMVKSTTEVQKAMDALVKTELKAANEMGDYWDGVASQGKLGKIFAEHARPGGSGSMSAAFGDLAKAARVAGVELMVNLGKKAITEVMDMAREGMQKGVEPFPVIAKGLYLSGKQYQEVMSANIQAVHASAGGYREFNKLMTDHNNDFLKTAGMDPVLAAKNEASSITMIKSFNKVGKTASAVSTEMTDLSKDGTRYRDVVGGTMEQFVALNQRIVDSTAVQDSMISATDDERKAIRKSIVGRVEEYQNMGLAADKAEELAKWMQASSGMKSPAEIVKEASMVQLTASRLGMDADKAARLKDYQEKREAGITLTENESKDQDKLLQEMAKKYDERLGQANKAGIAQAFGIRQELISTLGQTGTDFQKHFGEVVEGTRNDPGMGNKGKANGPGDSAVMTIGGAALEVVAAIDTLKNNVIGSWRFWGAAIVAAIVLSNSKSMKNIVDNSKMLWDKTKGGAGKALEAAKQGAPKLAEKAGAVKDGALQLWDKTKGGAGKAMETAKSAGPKAVELAKSAKTLEVAGNLLKVAKVASLAGIGLVVAQHVAGDKSKVGKVLNSNTVNDASMGAGIGAVAGSIVPVVGTAIGAGVGGAIGGLYGAYKDFTAPADPAANPKNPGAPAATPTEQAAIEKKRIADEAKAKASHAAANSPTSSVDPQQLILVQLQQVGQKLSEMIKLANESNELYTMTEEEKKKARKRPIANMAA
jgi:hypothetical protein